MHELIKNFIDGEWVGASARRPRTSIRRRASRSARSSSRAEEAESGDRGGQGARCPAWRRTPAPQRGDILARAAIEMARRKDELARALTLEEGKTLGESLGEVQKAINNLEFQAGEGRRLNGETDPVGAAVDVLLDAARAARRGGAGDAVELPGRDPDLEAGAGAGAAATPWCSSRRRSRRGRRKIIAEIFVDGGLPKGVLNVVFGPGSSVGADAGRASRRHGDLVHRLERGRHASSTPTAPRALKKVQCEMGGKNPLIVLEDADLELAATAHGAGRVRLDGPALHRDLARDGASRRWRRSSRRLVVEKARALKVGDGIAAGRQRRPAASTRGSSAR